ncbi:MAG: polymer-forming cytoskeletal protein [Clostridiales bacterium]|nr:polymer-forming cytoskeletal protein [Clostridiales bacterium]
MSIKENVAQAWKEIIGVVKVDEETEQEGTPETVDFLCEAIEKVDTRATSQDAQVYPVSIIADGMMVDGDAEVKGDIEIRGAIKGNITADGNVSVTGKVQGDLFCKKDVVLISAAVLGNIIASGAISLDKDSTVVGNMDANNVTIDGKIKGSLSVKKTACLKKDAVLIGDVDAGRISMSEGAVIIGSLNIDSDFIPSIEFDEVGI